MIGDGDGDGDGDAIRLLIQGRAGYLQPESNAYPPPASHYLLSD